MVFIIVKLRTFAIDDAEIFSTISNLESSQHALTPHSPDSEVVQRVV